MAGATILSAFATIGAVGVGYFQYRAAHDALMAADRNRSFEKLMTSLDPLCEAVERAQGLMRIKGLRADSESQTNDMKRLTEDLLSKLPEFENSLRVYRIWADQDESQGLDYIREHYIVSFNTLVSLYGRDQDRWLDLVHNTVWYCRNGRDPMINWFRTGNRLAVPQPPNRKV